MSRMAPNLHREDKFQTQIMEQQRGTRISTMMLNNHHQDHIMHLHFAYLCLPFCTIYCIQMIYSTVPNQFSTTASQTVQRSFFNLRMFEFSNYYGLSALSCNCSKHLSKGFCNQPYGGFWLEILGLYRIISSLEFQDLFELVNNLVHNNRIDSSLEKMLPMAQQLFEVSKRT